MLTRPALALLLVGSVSAAPPQFSPKAKLDLLADPTLKEWVFHLNENNSLSTKREEVAVIKDGVLQVTGRGFGYFRTARAYKDYHLVAEFKWGERTWSKREDRARDCGLLLHCHGPDGSFGGTWISCVQTQMLEGSTGDINVLQGKNKDGKLVPSTITAEVAVDAKGKVRFKPGGEAKTFPAGGKPVQSIQWKDRDPNWKDVKGFRGVNDVENPVGEWNRIEVICIGGSYKVLLNGVLVNEGKDVTPAAGWIGIQNEWAECWFRRLELWPPGTFKEKWEPQAASQNTGYSETGESILPRRFALSPEESATRWQIDGDYELELVAAEPVTCDPVDVVWDENGRMFVAEMGDYPDPPEGGKNLSRIRLLDDEDGDGVMDHAVTWADDLDHVQGLLPTRGGLLATTRTAILFLKDTDGDDRADEIRPLFHANDPRHNQLQVASPRWGPDNAIYLNNGIDGKEIYPHGNPEAKVVFSGLNLRYDPYSGEIAPVTGRGQFGAAFDDFGRHFFCSNRNPIMFAVMPLETVRRNPAARIAQGYENIQPPASPVWPATLSHTTSVAHAGTHTSACGLGIYRGDAMPLLRNEIFVCDPTAQLVTRNRLVAKGASFTAERVGEKRDFLVSTDEWCRPVQVRNGPDGALYVCDMYRRFIDHSIYFPDEFSRTNYMRAGVDQGRIWRLVRKGAKRREVGPLPEDPAGLVDLLDSDNAWQRIHAQRLLVEGDRQDAVPILRKIVSDERRATARPTGKVHAMWALAGLGALEEEDVVRLLWDKDPGVVENALFAASRHFRGQFAAEPANKHILMAQFHPDPRARFVALALWPAGSVAWNPLTSLGPALREHPEDEWIRRAVTSSGEKHAAHLVRFLLFDDEFRRSPSHAKTGALQELAALTAASGNVEALYLCAAGLHGDVDWAALATVSGLSEGLSRGPWKRHRSLGALSAHPDHKRALISILAVLEDTEGIVANGRAPVPDRLAALPLLAERGMAEALPVIEKLLAPNQPSEIQAAACRLLSRFNRDKVADFLFARWESLGPVPLREAITILTSNTTTALKLMEKMKAGEVNRALMPPMQRWSYCRSGNAGIKTLAVELFGTPDADRARVIATYKKALPGLKGNRERGQTVFEKAACITCHRIGGVGADVGPDISDVRIKLPASLLVDILDPNRIIEERWTAYTIKTVDGRTLAGLITSEDDANVTISMAGGAKETIARDQLAELKNTGQSLMPVGLEATITKQEMVDLLAFLRQRQAGRPR